MLIFKQNLIAHVLSTTVIKQIKIFETDIHVAQIKSHTLFCRAKCPQFTYVQLNGILSR